MRDKTNIVLTGVGGHGVITAANILGMAALKAKVNVFVSEIHGMAQRGGTVNCAVRMGNVSGALVASGTADVVLSTEPIEALRYIRYSNKDTNIITDITPVIPFTVSVGTEKYPVSFFEKQGLNEQLRLAADHFLPLDTLFVTRWRTYTP